MIHMNTILLYHVLLDYIIMTYQFVVWVVL